MKKELKYLICTAILMTIGLLLFKFIPMKLFGKDILFDASMHITIACFVLYIIYFFIDENKNWRIPYFILAFAVLVVIAVQRVISNAHNDIGLLAGLLISIISIIIPRWNEFGRRVKF